MDISGKEPEEKDFVNFLKFYASLDKDELFPPINNVSEYMNYLKHLDKNKMRNDKEIDKNTKQTIQNGTAFYLQMKPENDWHYAGKGVKLGTADKAICWWKPDGAEKYRVVYGDLKIRDVSPEELSKLNQN